MLLRAARCALQDLKQFQAARAFATDTSVNGVPVKVRNLLYVKWASNVSKAEQSSYQLAAKPSHTSWHVNLPNS